MKAMILERIVDMSGAAFPLRLKTWPRPVPESGQILIKVSACGVCHTELDEIEGRTPPPRMPVVLGHQVVGRVVETLSENGGLKAGDRVGVAWIYSACGVCDYCKAGNENLCAKFEATGRDAHGGYAEYMRVDGRFAYPIPDAFSDVEAAPLLCAGAIGLRSLRLTGLQNGNRLGLTGFGASAHLVLKLARQQYPQSPIYVFARSAEQQQFARQLGAQWAGSTTDAPPHRLHAIIDTTPVWKPVVNALAHLRPGGRLVINAIRKQAHDKDQLLRLNYAEHLWQEKEIKSVANVARRDVKEFLELAAQIPVKPEVQIYPLEKANEALMDLKQGASRGAKVLVMKGSDG